MFSALVLAAATSAATQFFQDFGGSWTCGNDTYHAQWTISSPDGNAWTIVTYGIDKQHLGGTAYVGWLPQENAYVYNDFHSDGALAQLSSPLPTGNQTWHWTGTYYPVGGAKDATPDITWTLMPNGTISRKFAQRINGKLIDKGSDTCTKT